MWRSFFLAIGIYSAILGVECLVIDHVELGRNPPAEKAVAKDDSLGMFRSAISFTNQPAEQPRKFKPREWMPWGLLGFGAVVVIYTVSLPRKPGD